MAGSVMVYGVILNASGSKTRYGRQGETGTWVVWDMLCYSKYIARNIVHSGLLIVFSLTSIVWLAQALRFIDFIVNQGVSLAVFVTLTVLLIPGLVLLILPVAMLLAVVFVYNRLYGDSELVVLESAGLSKWKLTRPVLIVGAAALLIGYTISLYLLPMSYGKFRDMQNFLRNNYVSLLLQEGVFSTPVDGLTVFIRTRDKDGTLHGVLVHDGRDPGASITMMAEEARLIETPQGPRFLLISGNRQEMRKGKLSLLNFDRYALDITLYAQSVATRPTDPQEQFITDLFNTQGMPPAEAAMRRAEGHYRLVWPFLSLGLPLVALGALLTGRFNRRGQWQRVTLAVVLAMMVVFIEAGLKNVMVATPSTVPVFYAIALLPAIIGAYVLRERRIPFHERMVELNAHV
jgi:lipopolysaccharide export system permease protein